MAMCTDAEKDRGYRVVARQFRRDRSEVQTVVKAVDEFRTYIENNAHLISNYGEWYRHGEAIATGFVESMVNQVVGKQFCKKQQMQ